MAVSHCLDPKGEWGKPRQLLMGRTPAGRRWLPNTTLPPQDRATSLHRFWKNTTIEG
ncbi:hypothetical protein [Moorena sp. SIOASIH]|uniref:hypothetical protein n=1 Tax=Moorena sp. SIOASIH TaxID=2607817 RepID=UPI0025F51158|nr:hypothetical protein [Moorena sp. SIOASIH]